MEEITSAGTEPSEGKGRSRFIKDAFHSKKLQRATPRPQGHPARSVPYTVLY